MPVLRFVKNIPEVVVPPGANLMQALLQAGRPVASSCHGDGVCARCRVTVLAGAEHLSPPNSTEQLLRDRLKFPRDQRVSCQTHVHGDVVIDASYW